MTAGDWVASIIALASLVVSVIALRRTSKDQLEVKLVALQLGREKREQAALNHPDIRAQAFVRADRLIITNHGLGSAFEVDIEFLDRDDVLPTGERERILPIEELPANASVPLVVGYSGDCYPPFRSRLTWRDANGKPQEREFKILRSD